MQLFVSLRGVGAGVAVLVVLGACSQGATPPAGTPPTASTQVASEVSQAGTSVSQDATAVAGLDPRFNPTAAAGGGINASNVISADDITAAFKTVTQASQLKLMANSSPPGAKGSDVRSVSVIAQDAAGVLKALDADAKRALGDALLTAAGNAWPNASVSLLVADPSGAGSGQIIGSRPPGGPNTTLVA